MRATAPEAIAVDSDVPLPRMNRSSEDRRVGHVVVDTEFGTRRPWMWAPGATKSGARAEPVLAAAEKSGTVSSASAAVPIEVRCADGDDRLS